MVNTHNSGYDYEEEQATDLDVNKDGRTTTSIRSVPDAAPTSAKATPARGDNGSKIADSFEMHTVAAGAAGVSATGAGAAA